MVGRPTLTRLHRQHMRKQGVGFGGVVDDGQEPRVCTKLTQAMTNLN